MSEYDASPGIRITTSGSVLMEIPGSYAVNRMGQ